MKNWTQTLPQRCSLPVGMTAATARPIAWLQIEKVDVPMSRLPTNNYSSYLKNPNKKIQGGQQCCASFLQRFNPYPISDESWRTSISMLLSFSFSQSWTSVQGCTLQERWSVALNLERMLHAWERLQEEGVRLSIWNLRARRTTSVVLWDCRSASVRHTTRDLLSSRRRQDGRVGSRDMLST